MNFLTWLIYISVKSEMCMLEHGSRRILAIIIMEVFLFDGQESPRFKQVLYRQSLAIHAVWCMAQHIAHSM